MGMSLGVNVIYSAGINSVNSHFTMAMNDVVIGQKYATMYNLTFFIVKKCQISRFAFFNETQNFSLACLLMCIPEKLVPVNSVNHLGKPGTIDAKRSSATP